MVTGLYYAAAIGSICSPFFIALVRTALFCLCILTAKLLKSATLETILLKTDEVRCLKRTWCQLLLMLPCFYLQCLSIRADDSYATVVVALIFIKGCCIIKWLRVEEEVLGGGQWWW